MAISTVVDLSSGSVAALVDTLLAANSGLSVVAGSISLHASGPGAVNLYDATSGAGLGIGAGVLLTSGARPGESNTLTWYGSDNSGSSGFSNGDADIDAVVNTVFQTQSYDATTLKFDFTVSDPALTSVSFDLVFGSEEYPEWVDAFVDCAVVIVDGVNYALFNKNANAPLSVISPNLAAGYFQDNANGSLPIEYDGVSGRLRIVAPLDLGRSIHTIKIGIADTGDHILDSGLFISGLSAGSDPGSGVVSDPGGGTSGDDHCSGSSKDEYFNLLAGDDTVYAAGGADIIVAGSGNDKVYGGSGDDEVKGDAGDDLLDGGADLDTAVYAGVSSAYGIIHDAATGFYSVNGTSQGEGNDSLAGIEQLKFSDGLYSLTPAGLVAVTPPPPLSVNTAGSLLINGLAAVGYTLKGSLNDADGLPSDPAAVSWQWYRDGVAISGANGSSYVLQSGDINAAIWLEAGYSDSKGNSESLASNVITVLPPSDGDLTVTLMAVDGPANAGVHSTITTLLLRAVELGESPNSAVQKIRSALKLPTAAGNLLSFNAFSILQSGQGDTATALSLAKLEVEVAILCSLSDDQQGIKLTLALLDKASIGGSFDLTKAADLATILGLDTGSFNLADKATYPQPLKEIFDRTNNIKDAKTLFSTGSGSSIESEWQDFLSNWDSLADTVPISTLSQAINLGPSGVADAALPSLVAGEACNLSTTLLLSGIHDPDNDPLQVSGLTTDHGAWFVDNGDGTWSLDPTSADYDPTYRGPLELSYWVDDGQNPPLAATQLLVVVDHANHLPGGEVALSVVGGGSPAQYATLQASDSLVDLDGISGPISYAWYAGGTLLGTGDSLQLTQAQVGQAIHVEASYTDDYGTPELVSSAASALVANVEDLPTGSVTSSVVGGGAVAQYATLQAANTLADLDGIAGAITYSWYAGTTLLAQGASLTLSQQHVGQAIHLEASYIDGFGVTELVAANATETVANVDDLPTGMVTVTAGNPPRVGDTVSASHNVSDLDGIPSSGTGAIGVRWQSSTDGTSWTDVANAVSSSLQLSADLVGLRLRAQVRYVDLFGVANAVSSAATASVNPAAGVVWTGTSASEVKSGSAASDSLSGAGGSDNLSGLAGDDWLDGGSGVDTLIGGLGNDTYGVDSASDLITEALGEGSDSVLASVTYSLLSKAANVESLTLSGGAAINAIGNALNNTLTGNSAANVLDGGAGSDVLVGGAGNDTYGVDNAGDTIQEAAGDNADLVQSSVSFSLSASAEVENLTLTGTGVINGTGNALANLLTGNGAANILDGGGGNDTLIGAAGADSLLAGAGDDRLDGGSGIDTLVGGLGNDLYLVDSSSDLITEAVGEGSDSVQASTTYSLLAMAANVENLTLSGTAALNATGNALNNTLIGNSAANVLDGGAGNDSLSGGAGNDTYVVDTAADLVQEAAASGIDLVKASLSWSLVSLGDVENLTLTGSAAINGTGNSLANLITGNGAANLLQGGAGNDSLTGAAGNDSLDGGLGIDQLSGGTGADVFRFDTTLELVNGVAVTDTISDFTTSQSDRIELSNQVFTALTGAAVSNGVLSSSAFLASTVGTATTASQRILYNSSTGLLSYDSDGTGAAAAYGFARLTSLPALTSSMILVSSVLPGL